MGRSTIISATRLYSFSPGRNSESWRQNAKALLCTHEGRVSCSSFAVKKRAKSRALLSFSRQLLEQVALAQLPSA